MYNDENGNQTVSQEENSVEKIMCQESQGCKEAPCVKPRSEAIDINLSDIALWPISDEDIEYIVHNKPRNVGDMKSLKSSYSDKGVLYSRGLLNDHFFRKKNQMVVERKECG